ncbi:MAG: ribonuclease P protein component [Aquabacterium sp.]
MRPPSLKAADFQRALGSRPVSRTAHFVLHVLPRPEAGSGTSASAAGDVPPELSTTDMAAVEGLVDDPVEIALGVGLKAWRLGLVLPKKQARRSVTRSLIRHQAREALRRHAPGVRADGRYGDEVDGWVVRLRAPFDRQQFPSAASTALQALVRQELDELWSRLTAAKAAHKASKSAATPMAAPGGAA